MTDERAIIKLGPKKRCRRFARKVSVYDSLGRVATASERTASCFKVNSWMYKLHL